MTMPDRQPLQNRASHTHRNRPRDSRAADGHGWSAGSTKSLDVGGQESQLAALHEFERLAEQKKTARE